MKFVAFISPPPPVRALIGYPLPGLGASPRRSSTGRCPSFRLCAANPPYLRTGIALTGDPDYRIVMEAYPFVTRKIISDDSPALQRALREILYRWVLQGS